jgi:Uncharacterized conserved protein
MWELYDDLIGGIPGDLTVSDYHVGCAWSEVTAGKNTGVALSVRGRAHVRQYRGPVLGAPLRRIAACVKSWNFLEASLGMAAINCWYNAPEKLAAFCGGEGGDSFQTRAEQARGKRVTVVGRFPNLEEQLGPVCQLSVLERNPEQGDYPDSACEFILPEQEMVFITGMTFINKTLPRLLQLIRPEAKVILVGPSVPLTPLLAAYGATDLDGFCVTDAALADEVIRRGDNRSIFSAGRMVNIPLTGGGAE